MGKWTKRIAGLLCLAVLLSGCGSGRSDDDGSAADVEYETGIQQEAAGNPGREAADREENQVQRVTETAWVEPESAGFTVNPSGAILSERIPAPEAYQRVDADRDKPATGRGSVYKGRKPGPLRHGGGCGGK